MSSILLSIPYQSCKSNILLENIFASFVCSDGKKELLAQRCQVLFKKLYLCLPATKNAKALSGL